MKCCQVLRTISIFLSVCGVCYIKADGHDPEESVCSLENRQNGTGFTACIQGIKDIMQNENYFWFGRNYTDRCPLTERGLPQRNIECYNMAPMSFSLTERLSMAGVLPGEVDTTLINSYLDVTIHEKAGSYQACGHNYTSDAQEDHVLDPVAPKLLRPWQARAGFSAKVEGLEDTEAMYALIIVDAGYLFLHGVFIDIPGNNFDISLGKPLMEYSGPKYLKDDPPNPYVFLLFKQESFIDIDDSPILASLWMGLQQLLPRFGQSPENLRAMNIINNLRLTGPVAVNLLMSRTDPYAAQWHLEQRTANICPMYVEEAAREVGVKHIPNDVPFDVDVSVTYQSMGDTFSICCQNYSYSNTIQTLDPIGDAILDSFHTKSKPEVQLIKMKLNPQALDFLGERYTLVLIDPDINDPLYGTTERPWVYWLVTNIPLGRVNLGSEIIAYDGPLVGFGSKNRIQFMLYRQTRWLRNVNPFLYTPQCTDVGYRERCLFEIDRFVEENGLVFAGASWMMQQSDGHTSMVINQTLGLPEDFACIGVEGYYGPDCSGPPGTTDAPKERKEVTDNGEEKERKS